MYKVYSKSNHLYSLFGNNQAVKTLHGSQVLKLPQVAALKLPSNVVDINASEVGRFSPQRERDICGPVIKSHYEKQAEFGRIDITIQADPYAYKYDCCGAVSLSSSMQSNVPSPFAGHNTHLNMPGSQWGQGHKYLSEHLHSAHYLTIKNEYRKKNFGEAVSIGVRKMSSTAQAPLTTKEKLKKAVKEYGSTVIVFHIGISLMSLGGSYLLVSSGVNIVDILEYIGVGEGTLKSIVSSNAGTFVIAYAVHKCFAPLRIGITLTSTPFIVRYLRNKGILKQTPGVGK